MNFETKKNTVHETIDDNNVVAYTIMLKKLINTYTLHFFLESQKMYKNKENYP